MDEIRISGVRSCQIRKKVEFGSKFSRFTGSDQVWEWKNFARHLSEKHNIRKSYNAILVLVSTQQVGYSSASNIGNCFCLHVIGYLVSSLSVVFHWRGVID